MLKTFFNFWLLCVLCFWIYALFLNQGSNTHELLTYSTLALIGLGCLFFLLFLVYFRRKYKTFKTILVALALIIAAGGISVWALEEGSDRQEINNEQAGEAKQKPTQEPTQSPSPTTRPTTQVVGKEQPTAVSRANDPSLTQEEWGKAVEKEDGGYTMKIGMDAEMATPSELYEALMVYRQTKGKSRLTWDDRLASYATERAAFICANGNDHHAGFKDFLDNQSGHDKLGFRHIGENLSSGMKLSGVHLVEWMYSQSPGHDAAQLGDWSHIGVGVVGNCSVLIFGNYKI